MAKEPEAAAVPFLPLEAMQRLREVAFGPCEQFTGEGSACSGCGRTRLDHHIRVVCDMLDRYERARRDVAEQYQALGTLLWTAQRERDMAIETAHAIGIDRAEIRHALDEAQAREGRLTAELAQARRTAEYWKAEHAAANAELATSAAAGARVAAALDEAQQENARLSQLCGDNAVAALMQGMEADVAVAQAAVAAQRERDAQVCRDQMKGEPGGWNQGCVACAGAIRAQREGD